MSSYTPESVRQDSVATPIYTLLIPLLIGKNNAYVNKNYEIYFRTLRSLFRHLAPRIKSEKEKSDIRDSLDKIEKVIMNSPDGRYEQRIYLENHLFDIIKILERIDEKLMYIIDTIFYEERKSMTLDSDGNVFEDVAQ